MNILVLLKQVPDLVEELEVDSDGRSLDRTWVRYILSEYDEHALEQAILLKERYGGTVTAVALEIGDVGDTLFTAVAKGADKVVKVTGEFEQGVTSEQASAVYATIASGQAYDLILTGVQAIDDLDGCVGARLAARLGHPYVGVVSGIESNGESETIKVRKEYPGGIMSMISVAIPAVIGIQSAMQPPRYVPIARIRQASKTAEVDELPAPVVAAEAGFEIRRMYPPETGGAAEMIEGDTDEVVGKLVDILAQHGIGR